jgi:pimeloyl-ACP methyl ester carboxylesterase
VFSDTLAAAHEWQLAGEALRHPVRLLRLATPLAASSFAHTTWHYPRQLMAAGWWAFRSSRDEVSARVAAAGIPAHVLWANRDSILSRADGQAFARELQASFTVAEAPDHRVLDHDWMFQKPELFVSHLQALGLAALS